MQSTLHRQLMLSRCAETEVGDDFRKLCIHFVGSDGSAQIERVECGGFAADAVYLLLQANEQLTMSMGRPHLFPAANASQGAWKVRLHGLAGPPATGPTSIIWRTAGCLQDLREMHSTR